MNPLNVFTPSQEITTIDRFAGRDDELQVLSDALQIPGGQIVIYGNRGVGKSSLARQLISLAQNDEGVLKRLIKPPFERFDFLPVYVSCDDSVTSIPQLLVRLLSDSEALSSWVPFSVRSKTATINASGSASIKILRASGTAGSSKVAERPEVDVDLFSIFTESVRELAKSDAANSGILIVVDEFDRIKNKLGIASLLKSLGSEKVKFALVGVATEIKGLVSEHESVSRQLAGGCIEVPPMSTEELDQIFDLAEDGLDHKFHFPEEARQAIIRACRGHPFLLHLFGRFSLATALWDKRQSIEVTDVRNAIDEIATKSAAPIQEELYKNAIGHSYKRELILKEFAREDDDEIHTQDLYARAAKALGINPNSVSTYVGHLASDKYGRVLEKTRERYYRFTDSLFKAYAAARPFQLSPKHVEPNEHEPFFGPDGP